MKDKIGTIIMSIIIILILVVFGIFGMIMWEEIKAMQVTIEPENFKTTVSENTNTTQEIETPNIKTSALEDIKDNPNVTQNVDYSNVNVDKYFYNQLENESKIIYKAFESNKENMKSGTYKVELGDSFSNLLNTANGQDKLGEYYQSAIEAYTYDNPDIFYLSPNKMYLNIETTTKGRKTTYYVYIDNGDKNNYLIDEFQSKQEVENAIDQIESVKNQLVSKKTGNTYNDIKLVHDYLTENVEYDTSISKPNTYNAYGALVNHVAVCEGYARSFKYVMDNMGIPCVLVIGKGTNSKGETENHAWNYVSLNGVWYAIDTTWDDPVVEGGGKASQRSKYKYFLKGSNTLNKDHVPSGNFTPNGKTFSYPQLNMQDK